MKKSVVGLILISLLLQTCREEESLRKGTVQFAFRASGPEAPGGRTMSDIPDGSVLRIEVIASGWGGYLEDDISIFKFGDHYISDPIPLEQGNYDLMNFLIVTPNHQVLYATPQSGSPLAPLVEHPLPFTFTVTENEVTTFPIEVISTKSYGPGDFGYASFGVNVVPGELFKLAVFAPSENQTLQYAGVQAYVLHDNDTIFSKYLEPKVNNIVFENNPDDFYTLVLIEQSWKKYSKTFRVGDLQDELKGNPLSITLTPALTFTMMWTNISFQINSASLTNIGDLDLDWGDGTIEKIHLPITDWSLRTQSHVYANDGPHFINISGDLDEISEVDLFYNQIIDISVKFLPELQDLGMGASPTPSVLDISNNKKLKRLNLAMATFQHLDISNNPLLKDISLGFNPFSTEAIDQIIHDLFLHATELDIRNGGLDIVGDWDYSLIGPPSAAAREELRTLRDDYGWYIYPENF